MAEEPAEAQAAPAQPVPEAAPVTPTPAATPASPEAERPGDPVAEPAKTPSERGEPVERLPSHSKSFLASVRDFVITTIVLLIVAFVFEKITSTEGLAGAIDGALAAQNALTTAVANLNPAHLFTYWYEAFAYVARVANVLPAWLADFLQLPLRLLFGFLALCGLPIVVVPEGTPFEWVLVFGVYLPAFFWLKSRARDPDGNELPGRSLLYAFVFTVLFYWLVQVVLNGTIVLFQDAIKLARLAVGGSIAITAVLWAAGKRGEHMVTERVLSAIVRSRE